MITINTHYGTVDMSTDLLHEHRDRLRVIDRYKGVKIPSDIASLDARITSMLEKNLAFATDYVAKNEYAAPKSARFLMAQGDTFNEKYMYIEKAGKRVYMIPINSWIDKYQGKYDGLFVLASNPGRHRLKARESSLIVYPSDVQGEIDFAFAATTLGSGMLQIVPPRKVSAISRLIKSFSIRR